MGCCMLNTTLIFIDCRQLRSTNVFCPLYRNQSHGWDLRLCLKALARKSAPKPRQRNSCMWVKLTSGSSILTSIPPLLGIRQSISHEREDFLPCYLILCQGNGFMKFVNNFGSFKVKASKFVHLEVLDSLALIESYCWDFISVCKSSSCCTLAIIRMKTVTSAHF